jgi:hypothetical protein
LLPRRLITEEAQSLISIPLVFLYPMSLRFQCSQWLELIQSRLLQVEVDHKFRVLLQIRTRKKNHKNLTSFTQKSSIRIKKTRTEKLVKEAQFF